MPQVSARTRFVLEAVRILGYWYGKFMNGSYFAKWKDNADATPTAWPAERIMPLS